MKNILCLVTASLSMVALIFILMTQEPYGFWPPTVICLWLLMAGSIIAAGISADENIS